MENMENLSCEPVTAEMQIICASSENELSRKKLKSKENGEEGEEVIPFVPNQDAKKQTEPEPEPENVPENVPENKPEPEPEPENEPENVPEPKNVDVEVQTESLMSSLFSEMATSPGRPVSPVLEPEHQNIPVTETEISQSVDDDLLMDLNHQEIPSSSSEQNNLTQNDNPIINQPVDRVTRAKNQKPATRTKRKRIRISSHSKYRKLAERLVNSQPQSESRIAYNFTCPFCPSNSEHHHRHYTEIPKYMQHFVDVHRKNSNDVWSCLKCSQTFASRDTFVNHVKESLCFHPNREMKTFECNFCDATFKRKAHLITHLEHVHRSEL